MDVKTYFDKMADTWDEDILPIDEVRRCIVFLSGVKEHTRVLDKTTPRLIQFHIFKNAVNPPFLGGFSIFATVAA